MPPRKSTSSMPTDLDDSIQLSPENVTAEKTVTATEQQLKAQADAGISVEDYLLPRSLTIRLAKSVLPPNTTIQKDAVLAIQKSATVFVNYLASHANDASFKRTLDPAAVLDSLEGIEFESFRPRLERELEVYMEIKAGKRKKKSDVGGVGEGAAEGSESQSKNKEQDEDVEMVDNPAKKMKRDQEGVDGDRVGRDGDETQEEDGDGDGDGDGDEVEEDEEEQDDEEEEDEEEEDGNEKVDDDIDRVEDLDSQPRGLDPDADADETDEDDGPGSQLRDNMGLR